MPRKIESLMLEGPAGKLEALLEEPDHQAPDEAVLVCHPHPLYGGTMHNKVVYRIARALRRSGAVVLRFNFRGVGSSEGEHDHGAGEVEDARAALHYLRARYPSLPLSLAGFSFGSRVIMRLGCQMACPQRLIAVGYPTRLGSLEFLNVCTCPKYFVQSTHDEFGPRPQLESLFASLREPKQLYWVEAADHFFGGALPEFEETVFRLPKKMLAG